MHFKDEKVLAEVNKPTQVILDKCTDQADTLKDDIHFKKVLIDENSFEDMTTVKDMKQVKTSVEQHEHQPLGDSTSKISQPVISKLNNIQHEDKSVSLPPEIGLNLELPPVDKYVSENVKDDFYSTTLCLENRINEKDQPEILSDVIDSPTPFNNETNVRVLEDQCEDTKYNIEKEYSDSEKEKSCIEPVEEIDQLEKNKQLKPILILHEAPVSAPESNMKSKKSKKKKKKHKNAYQGESTKLLEQNIPTTEIGKSLTDNDSHVSNVDKSILKKNLSKPKADMDVGAQFSSSDTNDKNLPESNVELADEATEILDQNVNKYVEHYQILLDSERDKTNLNISLSKGNFIPDSDILLVTKEHKAIKKPSKDQIDQQKEVEPNELKIEDNVKNILVPEISERHVEITDQVKNDDTESVAALITEDSSNITGIKSEGNILSESEVPSLSQDDSSISYENETMQKTFKADSVLLEPTDSAVSSQNVIKKSKRSKKKKKKTCDGIPIPSETSKVPALLEELQTSVDIKCILKDANFDQQNVTNSNHMKGYSAPETLKSSKIEDSSGLPDTSTDVLRKESEVSFEAKNVGVKDDDIDQSVFIDADHVKQEFESHEKEDSFNIEDLKFMDSARNLRSETFEVSTTSEKINISDDKSDDIICESESVSLTLENSSVESDKLENTNSFIISADSVAVICETSKKPKKLKKIQDYNSEFSEVSKIPDTVDEKIKLSGENVNSEHSGTQIIKETRSQMMKDEENNIPKEEPLILVTNNSTEVSITDNLDTSVIPSTDISYSIQTGSEISNNMNLLSSEIKYKFDEGIISDCTENEALFKMASANIPDPKVAEKNDVKHDPGLSIEKDKDSVQEPLRNTDSVTEPMNADSNALSTTKDSLDTSTKSQKSKKKKKKKVTFDKAAFSVLDKEIKDTGTHELDNPELQVQDSKSGINIPIKISHEYTAGSDIKTTVDAPENKLEKQKNEKSDAANITDKIIKDESEKVLDTAVDDSFTEKSPAASILGDSIDKKSAENDTEDNLRHIPPTEFVVDSLHEETDAYKKKRRKKKKKPSVTSDVTSDVPDKFISKDLDKYSSNDQERSKLSLTQLRKTSPVYVTEKDVEEPIQNLRLLNESKIETPVYLYNEIKQVEEKRVEDHNKNAVPLSTSSLNNNSEHDENNFSSTISFEENKELNLELLSDNNSYSGKKSKIVQENKTLSKQDQIPQKQESAVSEFLPAEKWTNEELTLIAQNIVQEVLEQLPAALDERHEASTSEKQLSDEEERMKSICAHEKFSKDESISEVNSFSILAVSPAEDINNISITQDVIEEHSLLKESETKLVFRAVNIPDNLFALSANDEDKNDMKELYKSDTNLKESVKSQLVSDIHILCDDDNVDHKDLEMSISEIKCVVEDTLHTSELPKPENKSVYSSTCFTQDDLEEKPCSIENADTALETGAVSSLNMPSDENIADQQVITKNRNEETNINLINTSDKSQTSPNLEENISQNISREVRLELDTINEIPSFDFANKISHSEMPQEIDEIQTQDNVKDNFILVKETHDNESDNIKKQGMMQNSDGESPEEKFTKIEQITETGNVLLDKEIALHTQQEGPVLDNVSFNPQDELTNIKQTPSESVLHVLKIDSEFANENSQESFSGSKNSEESASNEALFKNRIKDIREDICSDQQKMPKEDSDVFQIEYASKIPDDFSDNNVQTYEGKKSDENSSEVTEMLTIMKNVNETEKQVFQVCISSEDNVDKSVTVLLKSTSQSECLDNQESKIFEKNDSNEKILDFSEEKFESIKQAPSNYSDSLLPDSHEILYSDSGINVQPVDTIESIHSTENDSSSSQQTTMQTDNYKTPGHTGLDISPCEVADDEMSVETLGFEHDSPELVPTEDDHTLISHYPDSQKLENVKVVEIMPENLANVVENIIKELNDLKDVLILTYDDSTSVSFLEDYLKLIQKLHAKLIIFKTEIEDIEANQQYCDLLKTEKFNSLMQQANFENLCVENLLASKIEDVKDAIASLSNNETMLTTVQTPDIPSSSQQDKSIYYLICRQEELLILIQKYYQMYSVVRSAIKDEDNIKSNTQLKQMFYMNKLKHLPSNLDIYKSEARIEENFVSSLPDTYCMQNVEFENVVFEQKLEEIIDSLHQLTADAEKLERSDSVEYYYIQIVQTFYQWIEYIEEWILTVNKLPVQEHVEQCKLIDKELSVMEMKLCKINELTQSISSVLPQNTKNNILPSLSDLQLQIESTKQLAKVSFDQISTWNKDKYEIDNSFKNLNSNLTSFEKKLEDIRQEKMYLITEVQPLKMKVLANYSECKILGLEKMKLASKWQGCDIDDLDNCFNFAHNIKLMVYEAHDKAVSIENGLNDYEFSSDSLEKLCNSIDNFLKFRLLISASDGLNKNHTTLKESLIFLDVLLFKCTESFLHHKSYLSAEALAKYHILVSRADHISSIGKNKIKMWNLCIGYIYELEGLIHHANIWMLDKQNTSFIHPCPEKDLPNYISFFKDLQHDIKDHSHQTKRIIELKHKIDNIVNYPALDDFASNFLHQYQDLQENVDTKLLNISLFYKQWSQFEHDLNILQKWLSDTELRLKYIENQIEKENDLPSLLENIRCLARIESETNCKEAFYLQVKKAVEQSVSLKILQENGQDVLDTITEEWNKIILNTAITKTSLFKKVNNCQYTEIVKYLNLWLKDIHNTYIDHAAQNIDSLPDLQQLKIELWHWKEDLIMIEDLYKACQLESKTQNHDQDFDDSSEEGQGLQEEQLQTLKLKLILSLDKAQFLITKLMQFEEMSTDLLHFNDITLARLKRIKESNLQKNRYALLNNVDEIQMYKAEIKENKAKYETVKQLFTDIYSKSESRNIKNNVLSTLNTLEQYGSTIQSLILSVEATAVNNLELWNKYHKDLELFHHYLNGKESELLFYNGSVLNLAHLQQNIEKFKLMFQDFEHNEKLLHDLTLSSSSVKECSDAGIQLEIESDVEMLQNKWKSLKGSFSDIMDDLNAFENKWKLYMINFISLLVWVTNKQNYFTRYDSSRLCMTEDFKAILKDKKCLFLHLQDEADNLISYPYLHHLAHKALKTSLTSLSMSLISLEKLLLCCEEITSSISNDNRNNKEIIQAMESTLNEADLVLFERIPSSENELQPYLLNIENYLLSISNQYADLLCMRENLIFQGTTNFVLFHDVIVKLLNIQEITSKMITLYLKSVETSAKRNSFLENCSFLLQLFKKLRNLHLTEIPSEYKDLVAHFLKSQIMEIYFQSHKIIMAKIINSDSSAIRNKLDDTVYDYICEFIEEWEKIEAVYRHKMTLIKKRICLWQKYLYHIIRIKSSLQHIKKEIEGMPTVVEESQVQENSSALNETLKKLYNHLEEMNEVENHGEELCADLQNPQIKESVQNQIFELKHQIEVEIDALLYTKSNFDEIISTYETVKSNVQNIEKKLASVQQYLNHLGDPSEIEDASKQLEKAKVMKATVSVEVVSMLNDMDTLHLKSENIIIQNNFEKQLMTQKTLVHMYDKELDQYIYFIHESTESLSIFEKKCKLLFKWCEKIHEKVNKISLDSSEQTNNKLKIIQQEVNDMKLEFDNTISLGEPLLCKEETCMGVTEHISSLNSAYSVVSLLIIQRFEMLQNIIQCIEMLTESSETLNSFFLSSEKLIEFPLHLKDLTPEDIDKQLCNIQGIQNEIDRYEADISTIRSLIDNLNSYGNIFTGALKENAIQNSHSLLYKWIPFKAFVAERMLSLKNIKRMWNEFLKSLEILENWLSSKESIASKINYCDRGHSRNTYLEGMDVFEGLNHSFQDDVHLLHSVNSSFHHITRKEFNICDSLKNRVMSANNHWHKLYEKVLKVIETVKNILQMWEDFYLLKEHLLMFLTETDIKLTEMETTGSYQENTCESIEEDFKLHEDEKERFIATSKHLIKQSECSMSIINASVEDIESYWEELVKRLCGLKKIPTARNVSEQRSELIKSESASVNVSKGTEKKELLLEDDLSVDSEFSDIHAEKFTSGVTEVDSQQLKYQLYSEVAATSSKKTEAEEIQTDLPVKKICSSVPKYEKPVYKEKQYATSSQSKLQSFDDDCLKDLIAALKEAEERMDILEKVLAELTPSGMDEQAPNYSHLLAACRSSVDVIQHLSQFLFYDIPIESDKPDKAEIRLQSEDLLQRWQKIEDSTLGKESRAMDNKKNWESFTKELQNFEIWIQKALQECDSGTGSDADIEKFVLLLQKHKELISQIRAQKKIILMLNLTGKKFLSTSTDSSKTAFLSQRIKALNDHWDNLYSFALKWQNKLQSDYFQSAEFQSTLDEMALWLKDSEKRIDDMSHAQISNDKILHAQHTELYALKQQLEVYCNRLETLLESTYHLFLPESDEKSSELEENTQHLQTRLKSNLKTSQTLLIKCTEMLKSISSLLGFSKFQEDVSYPKSGAISVSRDENRSTNRECCSFLMRVARASFPIQAILLLLLGAAILLPMEDEEELSCRLSNNFATSLNPMLRYPDGPPPV